MLCYSIICEELSDLVEWEHVEPASLISRWVKTHLCTKLHWTCIDQESLPWPAFKGPTRMAFFSSKAGRRLLTVKYLGTIYPCDTRKMLGIIRWCCKNTHNALNYGSLLTCLIWCGGAELHCHIVSHCPVPWRKIKGHIWQSLVFKTTLLFSETFCFFSTSAACCKKHGNFVPITCV